MLGSGWGHRRPGRLPVSPPHWEGRGGSFAACPALPPGLCGDGGWGMLGASTENTPVPFPAPQSLEGPRACFLLRGPSCPDPTPQHCPFAGLCGAGPRGLADLWGWPVEPTSHSPGEAGGGWRLLFWGGAPVLGQPGSPGCLSSGTSKGSALSLVAGNPAGSCCEDQEAHFMDGKAAAAWDPALGQS